MKKIKIHWGIQGRYLKYTIGLLLMALLLSSIGVGAYVRHNMTDIIMEKYEFINEKMGLALLNLFQKSDEVTGECILYEDVQKSLKADGLKDVEKNALSKYFAYVDLDNVDAYCYVDNKQNTYTKSYSKVNYRSYAESSLPVFLEQDYASTKWIWTRDTLFGTDKMAFFIVRKVHSLNYAHKPGVLIFKMKDAFLKDIASSDEAALKGTISGIMDERGQICTWFSDIQKLQGEDRQILKELAADDSDGMIVKRKRVQQGMLSVYRQKESGMIVFTIVPDTILNSGLGRMLIVLGIIYLVVIAVAVNMSIYFAGKFTRPIKEISKKMTSFDGQDFSPMIQLHTHTELDQIGDSYNKMLNNIQQLLKEIKLQEKELHASEMNMLMSQINPHFLYNTLDTIYMLARINKEETTMRMIEALSKYLRLSLSKGSDVVTVKEEIENVQSYILIQQIRNEDLFQCETDCRVDAENKEVIKLILQPVVENAIKYGFCDIFEGGIIKILVEEKDKMLCFSVYNNGTPIDEAMCEKINGLMKLPLMEMKKAFPDKKRGYGVVNIITRLRLKYGDEAQFYYERKEDGTLCSIKIPER